jgi:2-amino-4-hydroxy-6-hydroxymethyldihydropteridine diphosphokinase
MSRAVLSIGSNLGDRLAYLGGAVTAVDAAGAQVLAVSPVFETAPWPPEAAADQDDYLNAVLIADDPARDSSGWLALAHAAEQAAARERTVRWGPRTLDVDIVQVQEQGTAVVSDDPVLTLPHPRAHERAFVLVPWAAAEPDAVLAGHGSVAGLIANLPATERAGVHRRDDLTLEVTAE